MAPTPLWARGAGVVVALVTVPALASIVAGAVVLMASVRADVHMSTSFSVGAAPRLKVDAPFGDVEIEAGPDGRIVVDDEHAARALTRAGTASAVRAITVATRLQGDLLTVVQAEPSLRPAVVDRNAIVKIQVPAHTELDISDVGRLRIHGIDAVVRVQSTGSAELSDLTLRDTSVLSLSVGQLVMRNVDVSGSVAVTKQFGDLRFVGALAPGGSSLDVNAGAGGVTIALPRPTDARATIATQVGNLNADPSWGFVPDRPAAPRRWSADLGPSPKGAVIVRTTLGDVQFDVR